MNISELRIGSWVLLDTGMTLPQPHRIMSKDIYDLCEGLLPEQINIHPIPITPEILQKCEFKYRRCGISGADMWQGLDIWHKDGITFRGNISTARGGVLKLYGYLNSHIEYVHQLQNIYQSLTGVELNIQL
jgi:hypothetical protein